MKDAHQIGDLVYIPQAVELIDFDKNPQLTIPLRVRETDSPKVGIITEMARAGGYLRIYCEGSTWSVKNDKVYHIHGSEE